MKTSELIQKLESMIDQFGDLPVVGMSDDAGNVSLTAIGANSCEAFKKRDATELLIEVY